MSSKKKESTTIWLVVGLAAIVVLYFLFKDKKLEPLPQVPVQTSLTEKKLVVEDLILTSPKYHLLRTTTSTPGAELSNEVGSTNVDFTLSINRLDVKHIPVGAVLVIPDSFDNLAIYSPFPNYLANAQNIPKIFIVDQKVQAFAAYENGELIRWGTVSTGKKSTQTPSRLYSTNWKGKLVTSSIEEEWVMPWYFNLDNAEGISLHQFDLPGYPASHACVRMSESDAIWFYDWADQWILAADGQTRLAHGTPVIVFEEYAYGKTAPWKVLPEDPGVTNVSIEELEDVVNKYNTEIQSRMDQRNEILKTQ